ncbi:MAG TPA: GHMP kinase [Anaerolinea thermolimosa]|uniref:GHMP kinase n=1 Tax=Anaerolinea thermolimosa TaxID=229919 RepID=A0A0M8JP54_9CHLR|nr:GHMP kinase [Anaerolinea thermolimosa]GAP08786.1 predicted kinase related to galactokinase and mevalonate kinase [Anaerolinea thermolimosa]GAP08836.1 predicted kinase related to galactokinase and mevalonate kinase [Anaerolinea thermolimosa]HCE17460.1 GHMP kinase [Anaerolinea thermolimosa]
MIIVQAPLRISFFGGGTDFPDFYRQEGGCVLTSTIDKYIFVTIKNRFDAKLRVGYTQTEMVDTVDELKHELIREALRLTGISQGVEITTMGDIPSAGSGLGSSSAVTAGALLAMYTYLGETVTAEQLAREACQIEIERLQKPIGVQDQYAIAYGGLRFFEFRPDGQVIGTRIPISADLKRQLDENFLLFYTGVGRQADSILTEQKANIQDRLQVLREMREMACLARKELEHGNLDAIGSMLDQAWKLKKKLASRISNGEIDALYDTARKAGALGGKITGAGGGGFLLLYCPRERQDAVRHAMGHLQELPFRLERDGVKVIFNYRR